MLYTNVAIFLGMNKLLIQHSQIGKKLRIKEDSDLPDKEIGVNSDSNDKYESNMGYHNLVLENKRAKELAVAYFDDNFSQKIRERNFFWVFNFLGIKRSVKDKSSNDHQSLPEINDHDKSKTVS
jgi:hypothetical protein